MKNLGKLYVYPKARFEILQKPEKLF